MKIQLSLAASSAEVLAAVRQWINCLVKEDYQTAFDCTEQNALLGWSPELIRDVIYGYGLPEKHWSGKIFKVTSPDTASTMDRVPQHEVDWYEEPIILPDGKKEVGSVWFDLPLNNEWSDLTVTFNILQMESYLTLELDEIHVF